MTKVKDFIDCSLEDQVFWIERENEETITHGSKKDIPDSVMDMEVIKFYPQQIKYYGRNCIVFVVR